MLLAFANISVLCEYINGEEHVQRSINKQVTFTGQRPYTIDGSVYSLPLVAAVEVRECSSGSFLATSSMSILRSVGKSG